MPHKPAEAPPGWPRFLVPAREDTPPPWLGRREFLAQLAAAGAGLAASLLLPAPLARAALAEPSGAQAQPLFVARVPDYSADLRRPILDGLAALDMARHIRGKRVVLKPNLIEPHAGREQINTHPLMVRAAAEAFLSLGAASVTVAEGSGHIRDPHCILEASGLGEVLRGAKVPFVDLNTGAYATLANPAKTSRLGSITLPRLLLEADLVVSLAKMKTHHWAGATLSMKNLFGAMPGSVYGWPKNLLHMAGIPECVVDITAALKPGLAIVDGIVGMEGDGPIMGPPVKAGLVVMGPNLPEADAACCRLMGIRPERVAYLAAAARLGLGDIRRHPELERGENVAESVRPFALRPDIPAQAELMDKA